MLLTVMPDFDEWLTTDEAAKITGFHPDHIRRLLRSRELEARKWGITWMIRRKSLSDYVTNSKQKGKKRGPKTSAAQ